MVPCKENGSYAYTYDKMNRAAAEALLSGLTDVGVALHGGGCVFQLDAAKIQHETAIFTPLITGNEKLGSEGAKKRWFFIA